MSTNEFDIEFEPKTNEFEIEFNNSTGGGTSDYNSLSNKPSINNVKLSGNKTLKELGIQPSGNYATKEYVDEEIATFDFIKIVDTLPETGLINRLYLVPKTDAENQDLFDEYIWINKGTEEEPEMVWEYLSTKKLK